MEVGRSPGGRRSYPYMPTSNWFDLRRRFNANPPRGEVNAAYLAGVLGITDRAAANIVPSLRALGLIDEASRTTDIAMAWRDDEQYADVARQMLEAVYPQALRDVAPPPSPDRDAAKRWFMRDLNTGEPQGERLARFYAMLASGSPTPLDDQGQADRPAPRRAYRGNTAARATRRTPAETPAAATNNPPAGQSAAPGPTTTAATHGPSLHVDIQVHIDPAATAEQIDAIFASMARHLYGRE